MGCHQTHVYKSRLLLNSSKEQGGLPQGHIVWEGVAEPFVFSLALIYFPSHYLLLS